LLRGLGKFTEWNVLRILPTIALLGSFAIAWYWNELNARFVATSYLALSFVIVWPTAWYVRRATPVIVKPSLRDMRKLVRYGMPILISTLPLVLNLRLDQLLMAALLKPQVL